MDLEKNKHWYITSWLCKIVWTVTVENHFVITKYCKMSRSHLHQLNPYGISRLFIVTGNVKIFYDPNQSVTVSKNSPIYQCQLFTFLASGLSSTIHLGSPSPHFAIFNQMKQSIYVLLFEYRLKSFLLTTKHVFSKFPENGCLVAYINERSKIQNRIFTAHFT